MKYYNFHKIKVLYCLFCISCNVNTTHTDKTVNFRHRMNNHITVSRHGTTSDKFDNHVLQRSDKSEHVAKEIWVNLLHNFRTPFLKNTSNGCFWISQSTFKNHGLGHSWKNKHIANIYNSNVTLNSFQDFFNVVKVLKYKSKLKIYKQ